MTLIGIIVFLIIKIDTMQDMIDNYHLKHSSSHADVASDVSEIPKTDETPSSDKQPPKASDTFTVSKEMLNAHAVFECTLMANEAIASDEEIKHAAESCLNANYNESLEIFSKVKDKYGNDQHFLRMFLMDAYALKRNDLLLDTIVRLFENDPSIACDPMVRDVIYALVENDETYETLRTAFKVMKSPKASFGLAWLIVDTPCNQHEKRFNRLLECYDAISTGNAPEWLSKSVKIWRPYKPSGNCDERFKHISNYIMNGLKESCVDGDESFHTARCSMCYDNWSKKTGMNTDAPTNP